MLLQRLEHDVSQRDRPVARLRLGQAPHGRRAGKADQLPVDGDLAGGVAGIRRSRTAAFITDDTIECTADTVGGASGRRSAPPTLSRYTHAGTSLGGIVDSGRSPKVG